VSDVAAPVVQDPSAKLEDRLPGKHAEPAELRGTHVAGMKAAGRAGYRTRPHQGKATMIRSSLNTLRPSRRSAHGLGAALMAAVLAVSAHAYAQAVGESWEYTGTMEMAGMKMPMPPTRACTSMGETSAPPVDPRCTVSDVKTSGNRTSFRVVCGPPDPMEGSGESTRTGDRIESRYRLKSSGGEMVMAFSGRKLGACTPESKKPR
jgi:hypothetical protein